MDLHGLEVVDYGCGSGVLAVAALKLGGASALGVDNDPQALVASRDNARRNGIDDKRFSLALPGDTVIEQWQGRASVVVANILAGPLAALSTGLLALLKPGGTLMLSGLLASQAQALQQHYGDQIPLELAAQQEDWVCLRGRLPG
jgi:ribosomal protein L11 methyltransferase